MNKSWIPLLISTTFATVNASFCTFSDMLSNNATCLPSLKEDGTYVSIPPFELQLQLNVDNNKINDDNNLSSSLEGIRFALEYYLNYTMAIFDEDAGFDNGGFVYAKIDSVEMAEPVRLLQQQAVSATTTWQLLITARAFYNLSPGGWIFSSVPTSLELLQRVRSVVEKPLDENDDQEGGKFSIVLEKLLFEGAGLEAFREVVDTVVVYQDNGSNVPVDVVTSSPSLRPTMIQSTTFRPTSVQSISNSFTNEPTKYPTLLIPSNIPTTIQFTITDQLTDIAVSPAPVKTDLATTNSPTVSTRITPTPTHLISPMHPTHWQINHAIKTSPPSITNQAFMDPTPSPTVVALGEAELSVTASPSNAFITSQSDNTTLDNDDNIVIQSNSNMQEGNDISKALLDSTSSDNNHSKVIAYATLSSSLLVLLIVSGAFLISRHGPRRKGAAKEEKDHPLHSLADIDCNSVAGREERDVESLGCDNADADFTGCDESKLWAGATAIVSSQNKSKNELLQNERGLTENTSSSSTMQKSTRMLSVLDRNQHQRHLESPFPKEETTSDNFTFSKPSSTLSYSYEQSPASQSNFNDKSALSTSTDYSYDPSYLIAHYDEERIAKKEMARELFLSKEQAKSADVDAFSTTDVNANDVGFADRPLQHFSSLDAMSHDIPMLEMRYQNDEMGVDVQSGPSLEYSASDATSDFTPHKSSSQHLTTASIISPSSLPDRRNLLVCQQHYPDPPDDIESPDPPCLNANDITVITNDGSIHSLDDSASSSFFPEPNSNRSEVSSDIVCAGRSNNKWNRCLMDCAPTSLKDLISPMRHEVECDEKNEIAESDDKWNHTWCGSGCGENFNRDPRRAFSSFSNERAEYENDWDFNDAEIGEDVMSGEDAFGLKRNL